MMSPLGLAIRPRIPASWRTCCLLPRAPESTIRETGLYSLLALVVFERAEHDVGDLVRAMRPDVDDLVVTFAGRDDALAILLLDFADLLVRVFNLLGRVPSA